MKRELFKVGTSYRGKLPTLQVRRMRGMNLSRSVSYITGQDPNEGSDDEDDIDDIDDKEQRMLLRKMQAIVKKQLKGKADAAETRSIIEGLKDFFPGKDGKAAVSIETLRSLADEKTGVLAMLTKQGMEIKELQTQNRKEVASMDIRSQAKAYLELDEVKAAVAEMKKSNRSAVSMLPVFEIKHRAADPMTPSSFMPDGKDYITSTTVQKGYVDLLRDEPMFWDFIKKGKTSSETYVWINKKPTEGKAEFISPGEYKPPIKFSVTAERSVAKKCAVSAKAPVELFQDVEGFADWVQSELIYQLDMECSDKVRQGDGTGDNPKGVKEYAIPYNPLTGVKTTNPNIWDSAVAVVTQLRVTRFKGKIVIFMNPVDYANAILTKAVSQGQRYLPPPVGAVIVEDLEMPVGEFIAFAVDYYKVLIYKDLHTAWGHENDDFTRNMVTAIAERRLHQYVSSNHAGFAIADEWDNLIAAINSAEGGGGEGGEADPE